MMMVLKCVFCTAFTIVLRASIMSVALMITPCFGPCFRFLTNWSTRAVTLRSLVSVLYLVMSMTFKVLAVLSLLDI